MKYNFLIDYLFININFEFLFIYFKKIRYNFFILFISFKYFYLHNNLSISFQELMYILDLKLIKK